MPRNYDDDDEDENGISRAREQRPREKRKSRQSDPICVKGAGVTWSGTLTEGGDKWPSKGPRNGTTISLRFIPKVERISSSNISGCLRSIRRTSRTFRRMSPYVPRIRLFSYHYQPALLSLSFSLFLPHYGSFIFLSFRLVHTHRPFARLGMERSAYHPVSFEIQPTDHGVYIARRIPRLHVKRQPRHSAYFDVPRVGTPKHAHR